MDSPQARKILALYRPGVDEATELQNVEALGLARRDPELGRWFERHCAVQQAIGGKFKAIAPPPGLKEQILAEHRIVRVAFWRTLAPRVAAAAALVLLGLFFWHWAVGENRFPAFRDRMVRTALRDYRMDLVTSDTTRIRKYLAEHQAYGDYRLSQNLEKLPGLGCALLHWHGKRVAMVCLDRGKQEVLFVFVIDRSTLSGAPATGRLQFAPVNKLMTASWSAGDHTYVLACEGDRSALENYFPQ
ncbi:MAG: hypothetical protein ACYDH9_15675 [Limisphaerales bacterium]